MRAAFVLIVITFFSSCSTSQVLESYTEEQVLSHICQIGRSVQTVEGSVQMKVDSKEAKGQFPAYVKMESPQKLLIEVSNFIGQTEVLIHVEKSHYRVHFPRKKNRTASGSQSWGGIPLEWALALFSGKIPCPSVKVQKTAQMKKLGKAQLSIQTKKGESFLYTLRTYNRTPWPEKLTWKKGSVKVDFEFYLPDGKQKSPLRWRANSSRGEIKLKWQTREINT